MTTMFEPCLNRRHVTKSHPTGLLLGQSLGSFPHAEHQVIPGQSCRNLMFSTTSLQVRNGLPPMVAIPFSPPESSIPMTGGSSLFSDKFSKLLCLNLWLGPNWVGPNWLGTLGHSKTYVQIPL